MSDIEPEQGNPDIAVDETAEGYRTRRDRKRTPDRHDRSAHVEMPSTPVFSASSTTAAAALARIGEAAGGTIKFGPAAEEPAAGPPAATSVPVFVLGAGRREREVLAAALRRAGVSVAPESDAFVHAAEAVESSLESLAGFGYPEQYWYKTVGDAFAATRSERAAADGKSRWAEFLDADRLPLGSLDRFFPRAQVIRVVGGGWSLLGARSARRAASRLSAGRYFEIRSADLRTDPEGACGAVARFVGGR